MTFDEGWIHFVIGILMTTNDQRVAVFEQEEKVLLQVFEEVFHDGEVGRAVMSLQGYGFH